MKRYAIPALGGVLVFGVVTGFAATLDVTTKSLGSGEEVVETCNESAAVSYTTEWNAGLAGYAVDTAPVTSAATCANMAFRVTLTDAGGVSLGEVAGTLDANGAGATDFSAQNVDAEVVEGVAVVITG